MASLAARQTAERLMNEARTAWYQADARRAAVKVYAPDATTLHELEREADRCERVYLAAHQSYQELRSDTQ